MYGNKIENNEITINYEKTYLENDKVFLNPKIIKNGFINILKKARIIKEITGIYNIDNSNIPVAILNMGILKSYDKLGVNKYFEERKNYY